MEALQELQEQNREISELCRVLQVLLNDTSVCDTSVARELFQRFTTKVKSHLALEANTLYASLLSHRENKINATAGRFLENSRELERIFGQYQKQWCRQGVDVRGNAEFISETQNIFDLILERISKETEEFFPLAQSVIAKTA